MYMLLSRRLAPCRQTHPLELEMLCRSKFFRSVAGFTILAGTNVGMPSLRAKIRATILTSVGVRLTRVIPTVISESMCLRRGERRLWRPSMQRLPESVDKIRGVGDSR